MANTTEDKLAYLDGTKETLKTNLIAKGMDVTDETPFRQMAQMVADIASGGYVEGSSYDEIQNILGDYSFIDSDTLIFVVTIAPKDDPGNQAQLIGFFTKNGPESFDYLIEASNVPSLAWRFYIEKFNNSIYIDDTYEGLVRLNFYSGEWETQQSSEATGFPKNYFITHKIIDISRKK